MSPDFLLLNSDKTEALLTGSEKNSADFYSYSSPSQHSLNPQLKNLEVIFEENLSLEPYVKYLSWPSEAHS